MSNDSGSSDAGSVIAGLSVEELTPIASGVLGEDAVSSGAISVKKIGRSAGHATAGIYRVVGEARTATGERDWSAVVKAVGVSEFRGADAAAEAQHEPEIYRSGAFAELCGGVRAPRCYAIQHRGALELIWLEDLSDAPQPPWEAQHFIATARNLGRFNAFWPEYALPTWEWLKPGGLRGSFRGKHFHEMFERLPILQAHPFVRRFAPPDGMRDLLQLWEESDALIAEAEAAPRGICHRDCHPKNLFPMQDANGNSYTIALDWVKTGVDMFGLDIGHLLASPTSWLELKPEETRALVDPVFEAYVAGLNESGWRGNEDRVRVGFLARLALEAIRNTQLMNGAATDPRWVQTLENFLGQPVEEIAERFAASRVLYLECKEEAMKLAGGLNDG